MFIFLLFDDTTCMQWSMTARRNSIHCPKPTSHFMVASWQGLHDFGSRAICGRHFAKLSRQINQVHFVYTKAEPMEVSTSSMWTWRRCMDSWCECFWTCACVDGHVGLQSELTSFRILLETTCRAWRKWSVPNERNPPKEPRTTLEPFHWRSDQSTLACLPLLPSRGAIAMWVACQLLSGTTENCEGSNNITSNSKSGPWCSTNRINNILNTITRINHLWTYRKGRHPIQRLRPSFLLPSRSYSSPISRSLYHPLIHAYIHPLVGLPIHLICFKPCRPQGPFQWIAVVRVTHWRHWDFNILCSSNSRTRDINNIRDINDRFWLFIICQAISELKEPFWDWTVLLFLLYRLLASRVAQYATT